MTHWLPFCSGLLAYLFVGVVLARLIGKKRLAKWTKTTGDYGEPESLSPSLFALIWPVVLLGAIAVGGLWLFQWLAGDTE